MKEGSLEAPTRYPIEWKTDDFWDEKKLNDELERVFDVCHTCRRCVSLCDSFPTLFDLIDESETMEVDGVNKDDFVKVSDQCYLCDLCYMTKCPYVPPHEWNIDFPHLMLRSKAVKFKKEGASMRDNMLTSTDRLFSAVTIPLVDVTSNVVMKSKTARQIIHSTLGIHKEAPVPTFSRKKISNLQDDGKTPTKTATTTGKVAIYSTCYGKSSSQDIVEDLRKVFHHNGIVVKIVDNDKCCGMPKLELGDLQYVEDLKQQNIPKLAELVEQGFDIVAPIPSCVLMYKQELPLMFQDDELTIKVQKAFFDPFEYLWLRHKEGLLMTDFDSPLGEISYQVACHQRVQNIGLKTRDILNLIPGTEISVIERCSGHDGTYAVKAETYEKSVKIARPVVRKVDEQDPDYFTSDCPMAAAQIVKLSNGLQSGANPISLVRKAYGI